MCVILVTVLSIVVFVVSRKLLCCVGYGYFDFDFLSKKQLKL